MLDDLCLTSPPTLIRHIRYQSIPESALFHCITYSDPLYLNPTFFYWECQLGILSLKDEKTHNTNTIHIHHISFKIEFSTMKKFYYWAYLLWWLPPSGLKPIVPKFSCWEVAHNWGSEHSEIIGDTYSLNWQEKNVKSRVCGFKMSVILYVYMYTHTRAQRFTLIKWEFYRLHAKLILLLNKLQKGKASCYPFAHFCMSQIWDVPWKSNFSERLINDS